MSSPASDPASESLLPPIRAAESAAGIRNWNGVAAARRIVPWDRRVSLLVSGVMAVCTLTALLTWAATSVGPAPHVAVTLAGSDYRNQLDLPANGYGDRAIGRLASWVTAGPRGPRRDLQLARPPLELQTSDDFADLTTDRQAAVALMFVSAHGISTPQGPAILPADAQTADDGILVTALLERMAKLPEKQKKILLLDCVHFDALPQYGVLLNGFSAQVQELDVEIQAIPNLVVVLGCDTDQRNWLQPAEGTNNWAAGLLRGLNGAAEDTDNDGWIDWLEVHQYCVRHCMQWSRRVCQQPQTPVLLPQGVRGIERSQNLALFPAKTAVVEVPRLVASTRTELLQKWWIKHDDFQSRDLSPVVVSPVAWRRFERILLRFEQFEMAGCRDAADELLGQLQELDQVLERATVLDSIACRVGVLDPRMVGFHASTELSTTASRLAVLLPDMSREDAVDHWQQVLAEHPRASSIAYLRREIIEQRIRAIARNLREQAKVDVTELQQASQVVFATTDPLQPVPQAGLILQLLARDLPTEGLSSADATSVGRLLELALRSDRVADCHPWWSPELFGWVADLAQHADQQRRVAGDLLFGEAEARRRAVPALDEAERSYAELDRIAQLLVTAAAIRSQGPHQLSRVRTLLAARTSGDATGVSEEAVDAVQQMYDILDQLNEPRFRKPSAELAQRTGVLRDLGELTARFQRSLDEQNQHLNQWQADVLASSTQTLPNVLAALTASGPTAAQRVDAWKRLRRLASSSPATDSSPENTPRHPLAQVQRAAAVRGKLWLAAWPDSSFPATASAALRPLETQAQVAHRLQIFSSDPQWRTILAEAGRQIGRRETAAWHATQTIAEANHEPAAAHTSPDKFRDRWLAMQRMSAVPPLSFQRTLNQQHSDRLADFLGWQSKRMVADGYWSLQANILPYYVRVAELLSEDRTALSAGTQKKDAARHTDGGGEVELVLSDKLVWTTQQTDQVAIRVRTSHVGRQGFASLWVSASGALQVTQPTAGQRVCRPLTVIDQHSQPVDASQADGLLVQLKRVDPPTQSEPTQLRIDGYFRGRRLQRVVDVPFASQPDIQILQPPLAPGGRIAIRVGKQQPKAEHGALTLVLDCSGSMGAPRGQAFGNDTKYAHAITAIESLLNKLPSGIQLSVWAFGQAIGEQKTVQPAEKAIRRIQSPVVWDAQDPQLRKQLLDAVRYPALEPWNESPLLAAMVAASNDLRDVTGLRSLVVITDGADNRVAHDPVTNPLGLTARELLKQQFSGSGITVNVIAFRVDPNEQDETRQQLKCVEDWLPAGRFVEADQAEELASALHDMLQIPQAIRLHSNLTKNEISLPLSPSTGAANWTPVLPGGLYRCSQDGSPVSSLVRLRNGDRLVLQPGEGGTQQAWSQVEHQFHWCERRNSGRWQWALAPVAVSDPTQTQANLIVDATSAPGTLAVQRPGELWVEAFQGQQPLQIRWQPQTDLPGAAYNLRVDHAAGVQPLIRLWTSERGASPVGELKRGRDYQHLVDLAPAKWQLSSGPIHLLSAKIETHTVPDDTGTPRPQPCLVLRGRCPPGMSYRLRTVGLAATGQDEQCFTALGRFTLRQWPVSEEQVQQALQAVQLISVDQFKLEASLSGGQIQFGQPDGHGQPTAATSAANVRLRGQR
ncbi:vWA domain-containing protein [Roseimaritima ulvae]|uniref:VWFA domain-containing protein n=1 Tax=Roseimaritima ulvae TaxID=980254 RepID=A0A5B9QUD3_9BACT|nr:hypothetical protein [Roseimaritima ulvae]QEG40656.1 hypothetical protein UC8_26730 [Roseimaritima ulvae]